MIEELLNNQYHQVDKEVTIGQLLKQLLPKKDVVVIGIEGASASGKTILGKKLLEEFSPQKAALILLDDYVCFSSEEMEKLGILTRYDWRSRNRKKFLEDIASLKQGHTIQKPIQDYSKEAPAEETETVEPKPYIIVEGNLDVSDIADITIFLFAPDEILAERRFQRDSQKQIHEDETKLKSYIAQSLKYYHKFLEPAAEHAQIIVDTVSGIIYEKI
ncbi:MAG: hypothetical protein Q8Q17_01180 [bacterium]|nr:hypothetical protein [bacterium]